MGRIKKKKKANDFLFRNTGIVVALLLASLLILRSHSEAQLSFVNASFNSNSKISSPPTFLYIPNLSFGIPVEQTDIESGVWKFRADGASHLRISANPGDIGSIIIYGPNIQGVFGKILSLKKDDVIIVTCFDGSTHAYKVANISIVRPNSRRLFTSTSEQLILFTSIGFGDGKRFVVSAEPAEK